MKQFSKIPALFFFALALQAPLFPAPALAGTARPAQKSCGTLTVAAASDLSTAMEEIARNFEKATGCAVRVSAGSSGNFLTQIENGAPFDVFFSADLDYPKKLESEGLAEPGSTVQYAAGKIVLWVHADSHLDLTNGLEVLRDSSVRKIAIANPLHAPYGRAAEEALRRAGIYDAVKDRLVLGENIRRRRNSRNPETPTPESLRFPCCKLPRSKTKAAPGRFRNRCIRRFARARWF